VTLNFTTTNTAPCPSATAFVRINLTPVPAVNAGNDISVCSRLEAIDISGNVTQATRGSWNSSGSGVFRPSENQLATTYTPSTADTLAGSVTLTLSTTGDNGFNTYSSSLLLSFVDIPSVNLGPDLLVCDNELPTQLSASGSPGIWSGNGTFSSNNLVNNPLYQPTPAELAADAFSVSFITNPTALCPSTMANLNATVIDGPTINTLDDLSIFATQNNVTLSTTFQNAGNVIWGTTGSGTIIPPNTNTTISYQLDDLEQTQPDTLNLDFIVRTVPDNNCQAISDIVTVSIIPLNTIDIGNDYAICYSETEIELIATTNLSSTVQWSLTNGLGTLVDTDQLISTYIVAPNDTSISPLQFVVTSNALGICPDEDDTITIDIAKPVQILAPDNSTICEDQSAFDLLGAAANYDYIEWSADGNGNFTMANNLSTSYLLGVADIVGTNIKIYLDGYSSQGCPHDQDSVLLSIVDGVLITGIDDFVVCKGEVTIGLSGNVQNATGINWTTNGNGMITVIDPLSVSYGFETNDFNLVPLEFYLESSGNGGCNYQKDTIYVTYQEKPTVNLSPNRVCKDAEQINLVGTVLNTTGLSWSTNGSGTFDDANSLTPIYFTGPSDTTGVDSLFFFVELSGEGLCSLQFDTLVVYFEHIPNIKSTWADIVCIGDDNITLTADIDNATFVSCSSTGSGVYSPSANSTTSIYWFTSLDKLRDSIVFTVTSSGPLDCKNYDDEQIVYFTEEPIITAP